MKKLFFTALVLLGTAAFAYGQEPPYAEELRFVRELRSRGYGDLAREYLDKLAKTASPELKKELPLERALTEMEAANDEPDSSKRIALYAQARQQFEQFLKANPTHPRAAETRLDIARATTMQGKTQLSRALLEEDLPARIAAGDKARQTLNAAFEDLKKLPKTPQTQLEMALNLLDQSETYLNTGNEAATGNSIKRIQEAREILEQIAEGEATNKITWTARAWAGRCEEMLDDPKKAIEKYTSILAATGVAPVDGKRLALYFEMLARKKLKEAPDPKKPLEAYLISQARGWLRLYPHYTRTPEGFGVQYLLARLLLDKADDPKVIKTTQAQYATEARKYLSNIEHTENEFTDRAKRLKIAAMDKQGTFKQDIDRLRTFEDCFVRAQYEQMKIAEDVKEAKDDKDKAEKARKQRTANIIKSLQAAFKKPDVKDFPIEVNTARALLTFYLLQENNCKQAIDVGESFARNDKNASSQAALAAIYALMAHGQLLAERERKAPDAKELQQDPAYKDEKARMLSLAHFMAERWPKERAGDLARHEIALHLLREEKKPEAIKELAAITDAYPSYIRTQYLLASVELQQADQDKAKGDPQGYYKLALAALRKLPNPSATADVETNKAYVQAKLLLALELVKTKKLKEVDALVAALTPKLDTLNVDADAEKEAAKRKEFQNGLVQLSLYSAVLQADADFKAAKYKAVVDRLNPLVEKFNKNELPQLKDSGMAPGLVGMALRANVQLNNLDAASTAIEALKALQTDKGDSTTTILAQLVSLITQQVEELRKKGDQANLKKAQAGFTTILNKVVGSQDKKKPDPKLGFMLARCYAGMQEHKKAVELLKTIAAKVDAKDAPLQHAAQLLLVREYRQLKETAKARELLDSLLTFKDENGKPGWAAKSIDAQKANVMLMEDEEQYVAAAKLCNRYVTQLVRRLDDNKLKEYYFEFYYHLVYCILKHGQVLDNAQAKAKAVKDAASRIVKLEKAQPGFGSEESKKRFDELLAKEAELREQYNTLKGGN